MRKQLCPVCFGLYGSKMIDIHVCRPPDYEGKPKRKPKVKPIDAR